MRAIRQVAIRVVVTFRSYIGHLPLADFHDTKVTYIIYVHGLAPTARLKVRDKIYNISRDTGARLAKCTSHAYWLFRASFNTTSFYSTIRRIHAESKTTCIEY
jgi:hypothetical protein